MKLQKHPIKKLPYAVLSAMAILTLWTTPAYAKTINRVRITVDTNMKEGMEIGEEDIDVRCNTSGVTIEDVKISSVGDPTGSVKPDRETESNDEDNEWDDLYSEYEDHHDSNAKWHVEYEPEITFYVSVNDNSSTSQNENKQSDKIHLKGKDNITLSGTANPKLVSVSGSGKKAKITLRLEGLKKGTTLLEDTSIEHQLNDADDSSDYTDILHLPNFSDDDVDMATIRYLVKLIRNNAFYESFELEPGELDFNLSDNIAHNGIYSIYVRMYNDQTKQKTDWVKLSKTITVRNASTEEPSERQSRSGSPSGSSSGPLKSQGNTGGSWQYEDEHGWRWKMNNNEYASARWIQYNGNYYYVGSDSYMVKNWNRIDGKWYHMSEDGVMDTGWLCTTNTKSEKDPWYYLRDNGSMISAAWSLIGAKWYYFGQDGKMVSGWNRINGNWYYMNSDGSMRTGWYHNNDHGLSYYLNENGIMVCGWRTIDGKDYCFNEEGQLYRSGLTPDGYRVDNNGIWDGNAPVTIDADEEKASTIITHNLSDSETEFNTPSQEEDMD